MADAGPTVLAAKIKYARHIKRLRADAARLEARATEREQESVALKAKAEAIRQAATQLEALG